MSESAINPPGLTLRALRLLKTAPLLRIRAALLSAYYRRRHVGLRSHVDPTAHVIGWRSIRIGERSVLSADCWLNVNHYSPTTVQLAIGDSCFIGRRNILSSGHYLRLGDYCLTGPDCRLLGSDHIIDDPFRPYVSSGATRDTVIDVGVNCWLGAGVAVIGNVKIGHGSVVGALSLVNRDIPPFSVVVGNPARIVKRFDPFKLAWVPAQQFPDAGEKSLPDESTYLAMLRSAAPNIELPVAASSKRRGDLP